MVLLHLFKSPTSHRCESEYSVPNWIPPPDGWLMINVDAATFKNPPRMGFGIVVRDLRGDFIASCYQLIQKI
jgi:hypothetical protein